MEFGDYIVFVDESGDHNLEAINEEYPVFVLAFCVFKKIDYINVVCPKVQELKMKWFGHDAAILHEREIRKNLRPFEFLKTPAIKEQFNEELSQIIQDAPMTVIATVIKKKRLSQKYPEPDNPYHLALFFCMERLNSFLIEKEPHSYLQTKQA